MHSGSFRITLDARPVSIFDLRTHRLSRASRAKTGWSSLFWPPMFLLFLAFFVFSTCFWSLWTSLDLVFLSFFHRRRTATPGPGDVPKAPAAVTLDACNAEETGEALPVTFNSCRRLRRAWISMSLVERGSVWGMSNSKIFRSHFGRIQRQNTNRQLLVDTESWRINKLPDSDWRASPQAGSFRGIDAEGCWLQQQASSS